MTTPPPADRFRLGEVWRSPRLKDWTVDKIDNGPRYTLARLRSVTSRTTQWRGVRDTGRDMTTAWWRVSPPDSESPQPATPKGNLP
jgi:hypothetical protein